MPMSSQSAHTDNFAPYRDRIESALIDALAEFREPHCLYDPVHYLFEAGGKRVRPVLTLLACEAVGGAAEHALPASVAIELLHTFTLVHDDIMDSSAKRRGRDTVHRKWNTNTAILSGDVMMGMAMRLLLRSAAHAPRPLDVVDAFSTGLIDVCDGQALDMEFMLRSDVRADEYFMMIERKTARLLETSVAIGASIGGADQHQRESLQRFAREIGLAFQMQDDILDVIGAEKFGKARGGDIIEGKRTWLMLECCARVESDVNASGEHRHLVAMFRSGTPLTKDHVDAVIGMLEAYGIMEAATSIVGHHTENAYDSLQRLPASDSRDRLRQLAASLMERTH
ncbi:MAG: polyprenyl synthetase family protein [Candidatus Kapabacteria bacterium]|nr:polyprenyl synthetase family protein [Candidatus Kapabacteria bacterium]